MNNLKEKLMKEAKAKGICIDGYKEMQADDMSALVNFYIQNPDWCMERDYPTLTFLKEHFSEIEDKGVFVGKTFNGELLNEHLTYIFHDCKGTIKVGLNAEKSIIPMLYLANGCRLRIVGAGSPPAKKPSAVPVYTFGDNDVIVENNEHAAFSIYKSELK